MAGVFQRFYLLQHVRARREAHSVGAQPHVLAPRQLAHHHSHLVPDERRIDVLIALRQLRHGCDVNAPFVSERARADVRRVGIGIQVRDRRHEQRHLPQALQLLGPQHGTAELQLQGRDEGDQVEVAAALAVPVDRALDVDAPRTHRRQRVRHGEATVVVGMNTERRAELRAHVAHALLDNGGQLSPVRVAQDDAVRAGARRRP